MSIFWIMHFYVFWMSKSTKISPPGLCRGSPDPQLLLALCTFHAHIIWVHSVLTTSTFFSVLIPDVILKGHRWLHNWKMTKSFWWCQQKSKYKQKYDMNCYAKAPNETWNTARHYNTSKNYQIRWNYTNFQVWIKNQ